MKVAITGGTGFLGRNIAQALVESGCEVVLAARGVDQSSGEISRLAFFATDLSDVSTLEKAFARCEAIVHCAGINRELGSQTYARVHVQGTKNVVEAARRVGAKKLVLISFLRARPNCGSPYHESKYAAEEIVRANGLDYTVLKCGVIYGKGDHMLDHLSHAFYTFPLFAFVGFRDKPIRPNAVADVARIVRECVLIGALAKQTVAVVGPDELSLRAAVRRVAKVCGRRPFMFPLPIWFHRILGFIVERLMVVPLVSTAQVRMLAEGLAEPLPVCQDLPGWLAPKTPFSEAQIRAGLPEPGPFHLRDLRPCRRKPSHAAPQDNRRVFFEMP
jgi:nucleoside-diphosphate-sugar epimerase